MPSPTEEERQDESSRGRVARRVARRSQGFTSNFLDLTPLGRQEEWEEPKGRATGLGASAGGVGVRYHDEYDT